MGSGEGFGLVNDESRDVVTFDGSAGAKYPQLRSGPGRIGRGLGGSGGKSWQFSRAVEVFRDCHAGGAIGVVPVADLRWRTT